MCDAVGFWSVSQPPSCLCCLLFHPQRGCLSGDDPSRPKSDPSWLFSASHLVLDGPSPAKKCSCDEDVPGWTVCKLSPHPGALILLQCFLSEHPALLLWVRNGTGSRTASHSTDPMGMKQWSRKELCIPFCSFLMDQSHFFFFPDGVRGFRHMLSEDDFMQYQHEPDLLSPGIAVCLLIYRLYLVSLGRLSTWCSEMRNSCRGWDTNRVNSV